MLPDPQTQSLSGAYGASVAQGAGIENPLFYDFMEAIPPASVTAAWNMGRVSNTMMKGGSRRSQARGIRQTFSPLRVRSFGDVGNIDPVAAGFTGTKGRAGYTPMQTMGRGADYFLRQGTRGYRWTGGRAVGAVGLNGPLTGSQQGFSPGTFGRITASARAGRLSSAKKQQRLLSSVSRFDDGVAKRAAGILGNSGTQYKGQALKSAVGATNKGLISGKMTGFIHGMEAADSSAVWTAKFVAGSSNPAYSKGLTAGAKFASSGTLLAKFGATGAVSGASRAIPVIGNILLARDLAKFSGRMVGRGIKLSIDAGKSAMGDLDRKQGPFGMGYQDNSVAATSRARGVMAISNSRLNMRSVLGNEAGYLASSMG